MNWVLEFIVVERREKCIPGRDNNSQAKLCKFKRLLSTEKAHKGE